MNRPPISQRDARWLDARLGNSLTATIGSHGCLVTAGAWLAGIDPLTMNDALRCAGQFRDDVPGALRRPYDFRAAFACAPEFAEDIGAGGEYYDAPFPEYDIRVLMARIVGGAQAIIEVRLRESQHFVAAAYVHGDDIYIMDPWNGDIALLCPRYGRNEAIAICRVVYFRKQAIAPAPREENGSLLHRIVYTQ